MCSIDTSNAVTDLKCSVGSNKASFCQPYHGQTAAFHFSLPTCCPGESQEYVAVVIPQNSSSYSQPCNYNLQQQYHYSCNALEPVDCRCAADSPEDSPTASRHEPTDDKSEQWCSEYRATIDECGKRVLASNLKCKRSAIYPKSNFCDSSLKKIEQKDAYDKHIHVRSRYSPRAQLAHKVHQLNSQKSVTCNEDMCYGQCTLPTEYQSESKPTGHRPMCRCSNHPRGF